MAFDERLADRVATVLADAPDLREQRMMLRVGAEAADLLLAQPHVRPMDFTGRPMSTMVFVEPAAIESEAALADWVGRALTYVETLPAKTTSGRRR